MSSIYILFYEYTRNEQFSYSTDIPLLFIDEWRIRLSITLQKEINEVV